MKNLKEGDYYINLVRPSLRYVSNNEDFTDMIGDFSKFSYLGVNIMDDTIQLINSPSNGFIFVRYPSTAADIVDGRFIRVNEVLKFKDEQGELKMSKEKIKVTSAEIIVNVKDDSKKPYYEIKYLEIGKDEYTIGYGSYKLDFVTDWYNNCFEIVTEELTTAERIHQLEKEKAALDLQIKNQEKYDEIRKIGDELALYMKALQDSGFSRNEAMQIFMMTGMNAMTPPFLRG